MLRDQVFISYSHDTPEHRDRVLALSERLRVDGIETSLDQYVKGTPPQKWPRWMLDQVDWADFVLLVCTETYYRRFRGHEVPGKGKGADWEGAIITQEIYEARSTTTKFVPVLFDPSDERFIPEPVRGHTFYVLNSEKGYQGLLDFLLDQAGVEPRPVGKAKKKSRKQVEPLTFGDKLASARSSPQSAAPPAPTASPVPSSPQAIKLLIVSASPKDRPTLGVDVEIREIKQTVRAARFRDRFQIAAETAVLADEFANCLCDHAPQILHFSGYHSEPGGILLMDENDCSKPVLQTALLHVLRGQPGLRMVVLNTCYSLPSAHALAREIDFAIGVEAEIEDKASILFAKAFYGALANGHSVRSAFDQAITPMIGNWPRKRIPQLCNHKGADAAKALLG